MHEITKYFLHIWILDHECAHVVVVASTAFQVPRSDNTSRPIGYYYSCRSVLADYVAKSGVLYWYSKKEGHGCCNGPNVKVECAIHI